VAFGRRIHRPRLHFRPAEVRHFFSFGAWQMGEAVINFFNSNLDSLLIGRIAGAEGLGLYSVAKQLVSRPAEIVNPVVTRVSTPVMAKVQDDLPRLRAIYLQTINHLSSLNFPIYAAIAVFAREITLLLFGEQWLPAVPLIQILAAYAAIRSTANPVGSLLLARGRVRRGFWWNVGLLLLLPAFIAIGAAWGVVGVAWSLVALQCLLLVPGWLLLVRPLCGASFAQYHAQMILPALAAAAAAVAGYVAAIPVTGSVARLAVGVAVGAAVALAIHRTWNRSFVEALASMARRD
jgi:O-antigen/teichoic acid export membrane protein